MEWHDWPNLDHKPTIVDRKVQKSHLTTRNRRGVVSFKRGTWGTNLFCSSQVMLFLFFHSPFLLSSVQFSLSATSDSLWPHGLQHARLPVTNTWSLLILTCIESVMPSNHLILCHPPLLLPSKYPHIRVFPVSQFFTSDGQSIGTSKYRLSICDHLLSFRFDQKQLHSGSVPWSIHCPPLNTVLPHLKITWLI